MTTEEIRKEICGDVATETMIEIFRLTGRKWLSDDGKYRIPTKFEIWKTVEFMISRLKEHEQYQIVGEKQTANFGCIRVECMLNSYGAHEWRLNLTAFDNFLTEEHDEVTK